MRVYIVVVMKNGEIQDQGDINHIMKNNELNINVNLSNESSTPTASNNMASDVMDFKQTDEISGIASNGTKLVDDEERARGSVKLKTYYIYLMSCGGLLYAFIFFMGFFFKQSMNFCRFI